ncbi:hypothetical protein PCASD_08413 [Puccinia coronata f. sp. avenae]|uniref:Uncharacterized protein n=1 Tax=Puccinia coronata f. sp. avenae TaxID=200324 RepID=A0A2N5UMX7_9BASI|nr:hypothetical protein PCASD_08413 [Puccinia coronata f. sp. avenae]
MEVLRPDQFRSTAEPNTTSTQIITGPHLLSIELSRAAQKSEGQSSSSSTDEDASKCNFQINASRPMGNKSDLASEQQPDITDEPIPLDLPRVDEPVIEIPKSQPLVFPGDAADGMEESRSLLPPKQKIRFLQVPLPPPLSMHNRNKSRLKLIRRDQSRLKLIRRDLRQKILLHITAEMRKFPHKSSPKINPRWRRIQIRRRKVAQTSNSDLVNTNTGQLADELSPPVHISINESTVQLQEMTTAADANPEEAPIFTDRPDIAEAESITPVSLHLTPPAEAADPISDLCTTQKFCIEVSAWSITDRQSFFPSTPHFSSSRLHEPVGVNNTGAKSNQSVPRSSSKCSANFGKSFIPADSLSSLFANKPLSNFQDLRELNDTFHNLINSFGLIIPSSLNILIG